MADGHSSFCSITTLAASRISERSLGKMPTTSVRRPISRLTRSSGLVERSLSKRDSAPRVPLEPEVQFKTEVYFAPTALPLPAGTTSSRGAWSGARAHTPTVVGGAILIWIFGA